MTKTSIVLVAFSTSDGAAGRSLISALEKASIAVEAVVVEETAGPEASLREPLALSASALLVAFYGAAQPPRGLGELIDQARLAGVPLIVVRAPGAHGELPSNVLARATEAPDSLAGRNSELAALHARVTGIVRQFEATLTPAATVVKPERARDTSMRTQSSDQAMMSSYEPRVRPEIIFRRPEIFPDLVTGRDVGLPTELRRNRSDVERPLERERASSSPVQTGKRSTASPKRSRGTEVPGTLDAVHFGVTAPDRLAPADAGIVDIWAFLGSQREQVLKAAREEHHEPVTTVTQGPTRIARGSVLHARLWFEDLDVPDPLSSILWDGEVGKAIFLVKAPAGIKAGPGHGKVTILLAGLPIAHLSCVTMIERRAGAAARTRTSAFDAARRRTAFASYASRDRREVIARVHGLEKAGVDVFVDVKSLRSGEHYEARLLDEIATRDVFFLFWSKAASLSRWVDKEWRFALSKRGADFIDPVPLVRPDEVPPPKELAETMHFADWTLAYTSARALSPARWWQFWRR